MENHLSNEDNCNFSSNRFLNSPPITNANVNINNNQKNNNNTTANMESNEDNTNKHRREIEDEQLTIDSDLVLESSIELQMFLEQVNSLVYMTISFFCIEL